MAYQPNKTVVYKSVGGSDITTDIFLPNHGDQDVARSHPVLINLHGGGFILGASRMVNVDQIQDCLSRDWIVVVPNHRLCPQVDILQGPITDILDLLTWIRSDELSAHLPSNTHIDQSRIFAFGTSAGGTIALALGFKHASPPAAILDFYGPVQFSDDFWTQRIPLADKIPKVERAFMDRVYEETPVPSEGGMSLEGQSTQGPDFGNPRVAFALTNIAHGTLMDVCFPSKQWAQIDAILNVDERFPPTCVVHGTSDTMVPNRLSHALYERLTQAGVRSELIDVEGEEHTFSGSMKKGSKTWETQRRGFDFLQRVGDDIVQRKEKL